MTQWQAIAREITGATGEAFSVRNRHSVGGGCINSTFTISDHSRRFFVKLNKASRIEMFHAEAEGLREICDTQTVRAPQPVCAGSAEGSAFLVLEYLDLGGANVDNEKLGRQLAAMHRNTRPQYGWHRDNTIGSTPQINTPQGKDWLEFWRHQRLGFQLTLAARNGYTGRLQERGERLVSELGRFFEGYSPPASLIHGDLWSGNYAADKNGSPIIFDPAVYYGDREADLAMTELFGGFGPRFYAAYKEAYPVDSGYNRRKTLYNLYHILNHVNLFGGGYLSQADHMIDLLLSEIS